ncbi:MAG: asparaginase [Candidatus Aenigmarchaeota archaeon]|nr:asparaginase [Candidatus Aenigmarchaeota archaeon]
MKDAEGDGRGKKILLMYTGGTVGMYRPGGDDANPLVPGDFSRLMKYLPLEGLDRLGIEIVTPRVEIVPKDSSHIGPQDHAKFAEEIYSRRKEIDGALILHGTDTMHYTASALSFMLQNLPFPVVMTGAHMPISSPRSDAVQNIVTAAQIAAGKGDGAEFPAVPEVCILEYKNLSLLRGNRTIEWAVGGGYMSPNYPALGEADATRIVIHKERLLKPPEDIESFALRTNRGKGILYLSEQPPGYLCLETYLAEEEVKALLVEKDIREYEGRPSESLVGVLAEGARNGKFVGIICNIRGGLQASPEDVKRLNDHGIATGGDMTGPAAIAKTGYLLGNYSVDDARKLFGRNMRGELTGSLYQE